MEIVYLVLATWRVTSIINREKIFERFRKLIGEQLDQEVGMYVYPDKFLSNLVSCFLCLSVWVAFALYVLYQIFPAAVIVFAISGGAILVERKLYG